MTKPNASVAQVPCISLLAQLVDEMLSHIDYHDSRAQPEGRVTSQVQIAAWRKRKEDALANAGLDRPAASAGTVGGLVGTLNVGTQEGEQDEQEWIEQQ